jgi:hypothetical protein
MHLPTYESFLPGRPKDLERCFFMPRYVENSRVMSEVLQCLQRKLQKAVHTNESTALVYFASGTELEDRCQIRMKTRFVYSE